MLETLTPKGQGCQVVKVWHGLDDADRNIYVAAIRDEASWPAQTLENELRIRGVKVSDDAIRAHRRRICSCEKEWF